MDELDGIFPLHTRGCCYSALKVHGVEQAESYFNSLDGSLRVYPVYSALLKLFVNAKSLDKADAVGDVIRKLEYYSIRDCNNMLRLYCEKGEYEEIDSLFQEMEDKGICFDEFTYNIRLNAYAVVSDIKGMEKLLMRMEVDPQVTVNPYIYVTAAIGYLKAGTSEKALEALNKAKNLIRGSNKSYEYGVLLTVYAAMKKKEDVYRLWNLRKHDRKLHYNVCKQVISSFEELDDLDGAKRIYEEWEEKSGYFNMRFPNFLISAYCKRGCMEEAELILNRVVNSGKHKPNANTWSHMASGYCRNGMMEKAVDATKRALDASFQKWKPDLATLAACLEYLKNKQGAGAGTEEVQEMLVS